MLIECEKLLINIFFGFIIMHNKNHLNHYIKFISLVFVFYLKTYL